MQTEIDFFPPRCKEKKLCALVPEGLPQPEAQFSSLRIEHRKAVLGFTGRVQNQLSDSNQVRVKTVLLGPKSQE